MIAIRYQTPFETIELREGETAKSLSPVGEVYLSSIPDEIKVNDNQVFLSDERRLSAAELSEFPFAMENNGTSIWFSRSIL